MVETRHSDRYLAKNTMVVRWFFSFVLFFKFDTKQVSLGSGNCNQENASIR